ncbi:MAG: hypothetical protein L0Y80_05875 [Ignavibacteriae bacterium]|nr:hypothetical protein [Ignavibacteriota bacterium]
MKPTTSFSAYFFGALVLACVLVAACQSSMPQIRQDAPLAPGTCRAVFTVVSIDTMMTSALVSDPCSKAPCTATLQVDSVIGYGAGYTSPHSRGERIQVRFAFTVAPTKDILPSMDQHYPGVSIGTKLTADLRHERGPKGMGESAEYITYTIYGYSTQ